MAMPARQLGDALVADPAKTVLFLPQAKQVPPTPQIVSHPHALTGFKVGLPLRIIRIGIAFDFRVPTNRHTGGAKQAHVMWPPLGVHHVTKEHPIIPAFAPKILVPNPMTGFVRVSSPRPLPQEGKDLMVDPRKGLLARPVLVILRPASNDGIKLHNQIACNGLLMTLHDPSDGIQEGMARFSWAGVIPTPCLDIGAPVCRESQTRPRCA